MVLLIHIAYLDVHDGKSAEWFIKEFEELAKKYAAPVDRTFKGKIKRKIKNIIKNIGGGRT